MDTLTTICVREGEAALAAVPSQVERMQQLLDSKFSYANLKGVESAFQKLLADSQGTPTENEQMSAILSTVRDEIVQALNILLALQRWIRVQVPKIEDGNNFGVSVQLDVAKGIGELTTPLSSTLNDLPGYFESRASAWDKIAIKSSKESKKSTSASKEMGGKDGDVSKTSESSSTEEKSSESSSPPDSSRHIVALDLKWFVSLHHAVLRARDAVVVAGDMIQKNMEKLVRPKGTSTHGGSMYSF